MPDLHLATLLVGVVSLTTFAVASHAGRRVSRRVATAWCMALLAFIVAHVLLVSDRLWITRVVPASSAIILGNWLLPAVTALAGFAWRLIPGKPARRGLLLVPLVALCVHRSFRPAFAPPPAPLADRWNNGVCLQTSPATCSPAAAATLLRAHGIDATEDEMARLCLTTERGTADLGVYRGLKLKTAGTPWSVAYFRTDSQGLRGLTTPALLTVRLDAAADVDPRYEQLWGWTPGVSHTVVFFGLAKDSNKIEIGDPGVGREHWSARDLHVLWHGEGLRLVRR